jgi:hypothetical protein
MMIIVSPHPRLGKVHLLPCVRLNYALDWFLQLVRLCDGGRSTDIDRMTRPYGPNPGQSEGNALWR